MTIERSLSKFPTLKQAVEAKVVNKIFDTKRDQTILFIRQFLEMQKKSIDVVFASVPTPHEMSLWESYPMKEGKSHPSMTSKMMNHMKDLGKKLYPDQLVNEIEARGKALSPYSNYKVRMQYGPCRAFDVAAVPTLREHCKLCQKLLLFGNTNMATI